MPIASVSAPIAVDASYLIADTADALARTSNGPTVNPVFTLRTSAGSDVAIHAADHTLVDFNVTGWYGISFQSFSQGDVGTMTANPIFLNLGAPTSRTTEVFGPPNISSIVVTMPPIRVLAGTQLGASVSGTTSDAGTWSFYGVLYALQITRLG